MDFSELKNCVERGFNRVPLTRKVLADQHTPVGAYSKFKGPYSFLLESLHGGEKWGRYSIIGLPCQTRIAVNKQLVQVYQNDEVIEQQECEDPLQFVEAYQQRFKAPELPELPVFFGGLAGYFAYDCVRYIERKLADSMPTDELHTPDILLLLAEDVLIFDNVSSVIHIVTHIALPDDIDDAALQNKLEKATQKLNNIEQQLSNNVSNLPSLNIAANDQTANFEDNNFRSDFNEQSYGEVVERVKDYALAGDIMQVVPSQRMRCTFTTEPLDLYRTIRHLNPSPYMYILDMDDFQIVGSSPEILARKTDREVVVRPIAGTRRRGHSDAEDLALEEELLKDPKEIAEHLMLIDLGRNDVGRVAEVGSVSVSDQMIVERYSHVMHIVSNVKATIKEGTSSIDVLRATLPAGTLSGAPKVRAMEIIDELEPVKRGIYGGAVGYISWSDNMDTAIAIRTAVIKDKTLYIQAGGGVVADSIPRLEWKETMNKARAMLRAAALAARSATGETKP